jgi:hypothetical protein
LKNYSFKVIIIFLLIISQIFNSSLKAQQYGTSRNDTTKLVDFEVLAPQIESSNHIKLYFKPEWFAEKKFRESLALLPFNESLPIIKRITNLSCVAVNANTYIFVPIEVRNYTNRTNSKGVILIGESKEAGFYSTATISGKITDFRTGKPLIGARITVENINLNDITDKDGNYKLSLPVGDYDLKINYMGYDEDLRTIKVNGNGIVDFELSEKIIKLKEVIVTDRAIDLNVIRTQMSTIRINAKAIKELPDFFGERDILKSVTLLPGIQSTGEFGTGFFVRGGSADQNLILVEDVPIFNSSHMFGISSGINSDAITNVTLLKAGIPAKYGERASSVMDIRLSNSAEKFSGKGGIGLLDSRLNFEFPLFNKHASLLIGGRSSYSDWLLHAMPDKELKQSSASFYDLNGLLRIKFDSKNALSIFGYISNDEFSFDKSSPYHYDNALASARYIHNFNDKLYSTFLVGFSRYRNDISTLDSLKPNQAYKINSSINYNNAKLNFTWTPNDNHTIDFGLNSVLYVLQPGTITPLGAQSQVEIRSTPTEQGLETATYIGDNMNISSKISAEAGLRFSQFADLGPGNVSVFKNNAPRTSDNIIQTLNYGNNQIINWYLSLEPRLSFRYSIDKISSLKLSYNRISQFINLITNTAVMSPTDIYKLSSPNIKPLVSNQIAMGYFRNFANNSIEASAEIYYKKLDNIVEYRDGATILMNQNLEADLLNASGYNYGIEFYLKKNTGALTGWVSYTYSRSLRHTTSPFPEDQVNGNRYYSSPFDIPHNLVINATYHITRRWRVAGTFYYNSGKPVTLPELKYYIDGKPFLYYSERNKYRLDNYNRLDLAITLDESLRLKQKWKGSWTLSIINVYGQKNPYSVFYKSPESLQSNYIQTFNLYNLFIIERPIPTLTYNFSF